MKDKLLIDVCILEEHKPLVALVTCAFSDEDGCEAVSDLCHVCPMKNTETGCEPQAAFKKLTELFNSK